VNLPRAFILTIAAVLFAVIFALRLWVEGNEEGVSLLFSLPVALLAVGLGLRAGLAGGVLSIALYALYIEVEDENADLLAYVTRATTFLLLGGLLGLFAQRLRAASLQLAQANAGLEEATAASERRARELARSNADLERYASVASHDLQEPLRMISTYTDVLAEDLGPRLTAADRESMDFVLGGTARMRSLIDGLLQFSRVRPEAMVREEVDLGVLVDRALENLTAAAAESGARVTFDGLPTVRVDERAMQQVFQNLIANAIKFRRPETTPDIRIEAQRVGGGWEISVIDNGIGIEPELTDRVFELFERLHSKDRYPGAGIGLALCERIIDGHGGRIWVTSNLGRGRPSRCPCPTSHSREPRPQARQPAARRGQRRRRAPAHEDAGQGDHPQRGGGRRRRCRGPRLSPRAGAPCA
jgi:signal transduction histidine kinase